MCNFNWYGGGYQCCQKNNNNSNTCGNCRRPLRPGCNLCCAAIPEQCRTTTCGADTSPRISSRDSSQTRRSNGYQTTKRIQVDTKEATTSFSNNIRDSTEPKGTSGLDEEEDTVKGELINGRDATNNPDMSYSTKTIYRAVPRNKGSKNNESITNSPSERSSDRLRTSNVRTCAKCKIVDCKQPCNAPRSSVNDNSRSSNDRNSAQSGAADSVNDNSRSSNDRNSAQSGAADSRRSSYIRNSAQSKVLPTREDSLKSSPKPKIASPCCCCCCQARTKQETSKVGKSPLSTPPIKKKMKSISKKSTDKAKSTKESKSEDGIWFNCTKPMCVNLPNSCIQDICNAINDQTATSSIKMGKGQNAAFSPKLCICINTRGNMDDARQADDNATPPSSKNNDKDKQSVESQAVTMNDDKYQSQANRASCVCLLNNAQKPQVCIKPSTCPFIKAKREAHDSPLTSDKESKPVSVNSKEKPAKNSRSPTSSPDSSISISSKDIRQPSEKLTLEEYDNNNNGTCPCITGRYEGHSSSLRSDEGSKTLSINSKEKPAKNSRSPTSSPDSSISISSKDIRQPSEKLTLEEYDNNNNGTCPCITGRYEGHSSSLRSDEGSKTLSINSKEKPAKNSRSPTSSTDSLITNTSKGKRQPSEEVIVEKCYHDSPCIKPTTCPFIKARREAHSSPRSSDEQIKAASINSKGTSQKSSRSPRRYTNSSLSNAPKGVRQPSEELILEKCYDDNPCIKPTTCLFIKGRREAQSSPRTSVQESKSKKHGTSIELEKKKYGDDTNNNHCIKPTTCQFIKGRREAHGSPLTSDKESKPASVNSKEKPAKNSRSPTSSSDSPISISSKGIRQPSEKLTLEECDNNNNGTCPCITGRYEGHSSSLRSDEGSKTLSINSKEKPAKNSRSPTLRPDSLITNSSKGIRQPSEELILEKCYDDNPCIRPTTCLFIKGRREAHSAPRTSVTESKSGKHGTSIEPEIKKYDDDTNINHCIKPTTCPFIKGRREAHGSTLTNDEEMKQATINSKDKSPKTSRLPTPSPNSSISNTSKDICQPSEELILEKCYDDNPCIKPTTCPFIKSRRESDSSPRTSVKESKRTSADKQKSASINSNKKESKNSRSPTSYPKNDDKYNSSPRTGVEKRKAATINSKKNSSKNSRAPTSYPNNDDKYNSSPRTDVEKRKPASINSNKKESKNSRSPTSYPNNDDNYNGCDSTTCPFITARREAHSSPRTSVERRKPASINSKKKESKNSRAPTSYPNNDDKYNSSPRTDVEKRKPASIKSNKKESKNSRSSTSYPNNDDNSGSCDSTTCPFITARRDSQSSPRTSVEKKKPATINSKNKAPKSSRSPTSYPGNSTFKGKRTLSGEQRDCECDQESPKGNTYQKCTSKECFLVESVTNIIDSACEDDDDDEESCCCCSCESIKEKEQTNSTTSSRNSRLEQHSSLTNTNADGEHNGLSQNSKVPTNTATQKAPLKQANKYPYCWNAVSNREMPPDKCYQGCRYRECGTCETTNMCTEMDYNCTKINTAKLHKAYPCYNREIINDPFLGQVSVPTRQKTLSPNPYMYLESMSMPGETKVKSKSTNRIGPYENLNFDRMDAGKKIARVSHEQSTQSRHLSNKKNNTLRGITMFLSSRLGAAAVPTTKLKESPPNSQENKDEKRHLNTFLIPEVNSQMVQQPTRPIKQPTVIPLSDKLSRKRIGADKTERRMSHYHGQQSEDAATHRPTYNGSYEALIDAELLKCGFAPKVTFNNGLKGGSELEPSYDRLSRSRIFDDTITENESNSYSVTDNDCESRAEEHSVAHVPYRVQSDRKLRQPFRREDVEDLSRHEQSQQEQYMHQPTRTNHPNQVHSNERSAPVPSEPEIQSTVLLEASTTCGMQNIISACAGPPSYLGQLLNSGAPFVSGQPIWMQEQQPELQYSQNNEQRNNVEMNNNIDESAEWIDPRAQLQMQCMSQSTMSYQSDNSIFQEPCMNNNDNIAVFQQNCDYDPNVKMPGAQVQHIPVGFYKQTVDKYGIIPMDSYFQEMQPPNNFNYSLQTPTPSLNIEYPIENVQPSSSTICGTTYDSDPYLCEHEQQHYNYDH